MQHYLKQRNIVRKHVKPIKNKHEKALNYLLTYLLNDLPKLDPKVVNTVMPGLKTAITEMVKSSENRQHLYSSPH